jgi:hypothetical protein
MSSTVDVYRDWLGVKETNRPLTHYQLLRLKQFEDDAAKVREHYRKMNAHVRKYAAGEFAKESQALLNELARAMLCLTDSTRKTEYDASLGRKDQQAGGKRSLEQILIGRKLIEQAQLEKARQYAQVVGVEIRDALVQQKLATWDVVMPAYAESLGVPYIDLNDLGIDENLVPKVPAVTARQYSCVPVMVADGRAILGSPNFIPPEVEDDLRIRIGLPVRWVLCTPPQINAAMDKYFPKAAATAEMSARGGVAGKPAQAPAADGTPAPSAPVYSSEQRANRRKDHIQKTMLAFGMTVIAVMVLTQYVVTIESSLISYLLAFLLASMTAGATWFITGK